MALLCCFCTSVAKAPRSQMSVSWGNKARAEMVGLRTIEVRGQRVTRGRGPENRAPRARIARLTQIGGPCGIPVHPGDIPTPKGVDRHPQPSREDQGPGPSGHRGPEAGGPGRPGPRTLVHPGSPGRVSHCLRVQATPQARARCKQQVGRWQCTRAGDQDADGHIHSRASMSTCTTNNLK